MKKSFIFMFMLMILISSSIAKSENKADEKLQSKEKVIKGKLDGIWQLCTLSNKSNDGSYKINGEPFFKIYKSKEKRFENLKVNIPSRLFDIAIAGKTKKKSDTQYKEIITYSAFNDIPVNTEILVTYRFLSEHIITTSFNRPGDMKLIQEVWMRVDNNYKPVQNIIYLDLN